MFYLDEHLGLFIYRILSRLVGIFHGFHIYQIDEQNCKGEVHEKKCWM